MLVCLCCFVTEEYDEIMEMNGSNENSAIEEKDEMPHADNKFRHPTSSEVYAGQELVGGIVAIFWDGDGVYYPGRIVSYEAESDHYRVLYENDQAGVSSAEKLRKTPWKIWSGTEKEFKEFIQLTGLTSLLADGSEPAPKPIPVNKKLKTPTYAAMIMKAVINLNEKEGSSLNAIRKYILTNYEIQNQQRASFNNLTLKAVNRAVANEELEKVKHSFRLTMAEREKRKIVEKTQLEEEFRKVNSFPMFPGMSRKYTPFIIDQESVGMVVSSHNKALRKELLDARDKRDRFLLKRIELLKPFLPKKNYFQRLIRQKEKLRQRVLAAQEMKRQHQANQSYSSQLYGVAANSMLSDALQEAERFLATVDIHQDWYLQEEKHLDPVIRKLAEEPDEEEEEEEEGEAESGDGAEADEKTAAGEAVAAAAIVEMEVQQLLEEEQPLAAARGNSSSISYSTLAGVEIISKMPSRLQGELHDHQVTGISWMVHMYQQGMPMILGDQMGLGKTIQTIGFLAYLQETLHKTGPHLIVVPLSVLSNWLAEIDKFCPSFRTIRFHGPKIERERIKLEEMKSLAEFDIVVTTYEILVSEINFFRRRYVWTTVIIDEGHRLKNEKSQFSEKIRCVPCVGKVILTGTPLQNNLRELWALLFYLCPEIFPSGEKFDEGFDLLRGKLNSDILRQARKLLSVFMLRRLKEQVSFQLPSRKEVTLLVNLTAQQIDLYKQLLCGLDGSMIDIVMREGSSSSNSSSTAAAAMVVAAAVDDGGGEGEEEEEEEGIAASHGHSSSSSLVRNASSSNELNKSSATKDKDKDKESSSGDPSHDSDWRKLMNILLQLRKICNHTYLLSSHSSISYPSSSNNSSSSHGGGIIGMYGQTITEEIVHGSGKLMMLDRMLPLLRADGHRILLFSQFTSMLDILEDYCELRDYPFVRLDGETNRVKRRLDCRRFNAKNSPLFIFLISTRAGGLGLNLASADTVILYDSDWNPQVDLQAMERAHRIGQTKPVRVFRLICRGSVEERMISRAEKKLFLNAMVAEHDPDEQLAEAAADGQAAASNNQDLQDVMQALGIGGGSLSKGELASLIRFGANAIFESEAAAVANAANAAAGEGGSGSGSNSNSSNIVHSISDEELEILLERKGRDVIHEAATAVSSIALAAAAASSSNSSSNSHSSEMDQSSSSQQQHGQEQLTSVPAILDHPQTTTASTAAASGSVAVAVPVVVDAFALAQQALKERMSTLKEVDLRQLGDFVYQKKKSTQKMQTIDISLIMEDDTKRERKERIVMVNGKGTGYGGNVPILAENLWSDTAAGQGGGEEAGGEGAEKDEEEGDGANNGNSGHNRLAGYYGKAARGRQWKHQSFCTLCGRGVTKDAFHKCAHCPFVFHQGCGESCGLFTKGSGLLICPHHRCADCHRPTASAGGLLFRCMTCLTSYCEDCLPQDEIDSIGRCKELEKAGYISKQAYYITCPYCCQVAGVKAKGVLGEDNNAAAVENKQAAIADEDGGAGPAAAAGEEEEEEDVQKFATQVMRIHWQEIIDPPKPVKKNGKKKNDNGKKRNRKSSSSNGGDGGGGSGSAAKKKARLSNGEAGGQQQEEEDDEEEDDEEDEDGEGEGGSRRNKQRFQMDLDHPEVAEETRLTTALTLFTDHPGIQMMLALIQEAIQEQTKEGVTLPKAVAAFDLSEEMSTIIMKVESGRYRSPALFIKDLKYVVEGRLMSTALKAAQGMKERKDKIAFLGREVSQYLSETMEENLVL